MEITKDIKYIGVNDHDIDLFEGQYVVENGMAYNSYVILDDKIAIMDTVDKNFAKGLQILKRLFAAESPITSLFSTWSRIIRSTSSTF